jgi:hypothetical protein
MHSFEFDRNDGVLRASVQGFWSLNDAEAYGRDLQANAMIARRFAGHLKLLIDSSEHGVQAPDVHARLVQIRKNALKSPKDRIAVCLVSSLARRQVGRTIDTPQIAMFAEPSSAREWLLRCVDENVVKPIPSLSAN